MRRKKTTTQREPRKFAIQTLVSRETLEYVKREARQSLRTVSDWLRLRLEEMEKDSPGVIRRNRKD